LTECIAPGRGKRREQLTGLHARVATKCRCYNPLRRVGRPVGILDSSALHLRPKTPLTEGILFASRSLLIGDTRYPYE
jgi:hypothetical protein